jgi:predicted nucleic acid-binding protein
MTREGIERLAFDTNAVIYLLDRIDPYFPMLASLFQDVEAGEKEAVVSVITEAETLIRPLRDGRDLSRLRAFYSHPGVRLIDVRRPIAWHAAQIRADTNLKLPDALIAATAAAAGCAAIIGNDREFSQRFTAVPYVYLEDAVQKI